MKDLSKKFGNTIMYGNIYNIQPSLRGEKLQHLQQEQQVR